MKAYPFLMSKNLFLPGEAHPVVMPDFIRDRESALFLLGDTQRGSPLTAAGEPAHYLVQNHSALGPLHVVFRRRVATVDDLGPKGSEQIGVKAGTNRLRDESGRDLTVTEGFVVRASDAGFEKDFAYSQAHLDAAREAMLPKFQEFWPSKEWGDAQAFSSTSINLTSDPAHKLPLIAQNALAEQTLRGTAPAAAEAATKTGAQGATKATATVEKAAESATREERSWMRRNFRLSGRNQKLVFATVALVALGGFVAARHWRGQSAPAQADMSR
jgi:hypothetical protein